MRVICTTPDPGTESAIGNPLNAIIINPFAAIHGTMVSGIVKTRIQTAIVVVFAGARPGDCAVISTVALPGPE